VSTGQRRQGDLAGEEQAATEHQDAHDLNYRGGAAVGSNR
jgi:hypothetical protein